MTLKAPKLTPIEERYTKAMRVPAPRIPSEGNGTPYPPDTFEERLRKYDREDHPQPRKRNPYKGEV